MHVDVGLVEQRGVQAEAGVVDQDVDGTGRVLEALRDPEDVVADGQVRRDDLHVDVELGAQFGSDRVEAVGVAGDEDQIGAPAGELARECVPDAGSPARDQC